VIQSIICLSIHEALSIRDYCVSYVKTSESNTATVGSRVNGYRSLLLQYGNSSLLDYLGIPGHGCLQTRERFCILLVIGMLGRNYYLRLACGIFFDSKTAKKGVPYIVVMVEICLETGGFYLSRPPRPDGKVGILPAFRRDRT
jgi:hypothetical protein